MADVISVKVDEETRQRMRRLPGIDWSEVIRQTILNKIEDEEARLQSHEREKLERAARETDALRTRSRNSWDSTEEIRRQRRRLKSEAGKAR